MPLPYPAPSPRTRCPTIQGKELAAFVLQRRTEGKSFPAIARELDRTQGYIYKVYKKALREIIKEPAEQVIKMENRKLDLLEQIAFEMIQKEFPLVSGGGVVRDVLEDANGKPVLDEDGNPVQVKLTDIGPRLAVLNALLKIQERRARLNGLDKPVKTALTNPEGDGEASWARFYLPHNGREDITDVTPE